MDHDRIRAVALALTLLLAACAGGGGDAEPTPSSSTTPPELSQPTPSAAPAPSGTTATPASPTATPTATTSPAATPTDPGTGEDPGPAQPALWPPAGDGADTAEAAARGFATEVLGLSTPTLGELREGDARSGEIDLLFSGETGDRELVRSTLLVRQLGPDDGWFVIAAVSEVQTIAAPEAGTQVPAGPVTVEGAARGFEATVLVTAYDLADPLTPLAQAIVQGGAFADPEPFTTSLDLSGVAPGTTVGIVVRGGTGADADPGDLAAVPVVVG